MLRFFYKLFIYFWIVCIDIYPSEVRGQENQLNGVGILDQQTFKTQSDLSKGLPSAPNKNNQYWKPGNLSNTPSVIPRASALKEPEKLDDTLVPNLYRRDSIKPESQTFPFNAGFEKKYKIIQNFKNYIRSQSKNSKNSLQRDLKNWVSQYKWDPSDIGFKEATILFSNFKKDITRPRSIDEINDIYEKILNGSINYCGSSSLCGNAPTTPPIPPPPTNIGAIDAKYCGSPQAISYGLPTPGGVSKKICGPLYSSPPIPEKFPQKAELGSLISVKIPRYSFYPFPTTVALLSGEALLCSGVRIGPKRILTAAHCVCGKKISRALLGSTIYPGAPRKIGYVQKRNVVSAKPLDKEFCQAAKAEEENLWQRGDLAVVELRQEFDVGHLAIKIPIASAEIDISKTNTYMVGFGAHQTLWRGGVKRAAPVEVKVCDSLSAKVTGCVENKELVAVTPKNSHLDSCRGDSGGGLYVENPKTGKLALLGIISRSIADSKFICGNGGIFVDLRIAEYRNKISALLRN